MHDPTGDIVVTARRTAERLQDVPLSVTAIDAQSLDERNVRNVADLPAVAPGLSASWITSFICPRGVTACGSSPAAICSRSARRSIAADARSEEHTSELQSLMRISYAVFCLKKQKEETTQ